MSHSVEMMLKGCQNPLKVSMALNKSKLTLRPRLSQPHMLRLIDSRLRIWNGKLSTKRSFMTSSVNSSRIKLAIWWLKSRDSRRPCLSKSRRLLWKTRRVTRWSRRSSSWIKIRRLIMIPSSSWEMKLMHLRCREEPTQDLLMMSSNLDWTLLCRRIRSKRVNLSF